jgi:hypothetical protein
MPLSDDPWIAEHSIIDPERLHALGMITLFWNHCERMLFFIFCFVFKFGPRLGWIIAHDMGDKSLSDRIKEHLKASPLLPDEQALILNALDVYDVCRQNRNALTHFTVRITSKDENENDFKFVRTKGPTAVPVEFPSTLKDVRAIAFNTKMLSVYLHQIYQALTAREGGKDAPLPPIVDAPELLLKLLPQSHKEPTHQRPPSHPRLTEEEWLAKYRKEGRDPLQSAE